MRGRDLQQQLAAQLILRDLVADGENRVAFDRFRPRSRDLAVNQAAVNAQQRDLHMAGSGAAGAAGNNGRFCGWRGSGGAVVLAWSGFVDHAS